MAVVTMKALLETGVHFGHRTRKWNPKMRPYIFTERNGIHILDLQQTMKAIEDVYAVVCDAVAEGGSVLFVGTKRQAQETIAREAAQCGMPYVNHRWLGGTLTNWRTIKQRITYLEDLEERQGRGEFELLSKKEALMMQRKIDKLRQRLGGIRAMAALPTLLFVVDVAKESTAVREANILDIPVVAMVDTNGDPDLIDYVIPANDDAIRAIKLVTSIIASAVLEGVGLRKDIEEEEDFMAVPAHERDLSDYEEAEIDDEAYLGEATLAKLRGGTLRFDDGGEDFEDEALDEDAEGEADEDDEAISESEPSEEPEEPSVESEETDEE